MIRVAVAASIIVAVAELSRRYPRAGAVLLSLPLVSILALCFGWLQYHDLPAISKIAKETLILVPLGLPFFVPLAFAERLGLTFWTAFISGLALATITIVAWLWLAPAEA
jgi:hypothetical protein